MIRLLGNRETKKLGQIYCFFTQKAVNLVLKAFCHIGTFPIWQKALGTRLKKKYEMNCWTNLSKNGLNRIQTCGAQCASLVNFSRSSLNISWATILVKILGTSHKIALLQSLITCHPDSPPPRFNVAWIKRHSTISTLHKNRGEGGSEDPKRMFLRRCFRKHHENTEICQCPNSFCPGLFWFLVTFSFYLWYILSCQ